MAAARALLGAAAAHCPVSQPTLSRLGHAPAPPRPRPAQLSTTSIQSLNVQRSTLHVSPPTACRRPAASTTSTLQRAWPKIGDGRRVATIPSPTQLAALPLPQHRSTLTAQRSARPSCALRPPSTTRRPRPSGLPPRSPRRSPEKRKNRVPPCPCALARSRPVSRFSVRERCNEYSRGLRHSHSRSPPGAHVHSAPVAVGK